ncbi:TIGR04255 family protein [Pseudomonas coronafaciens]|uniref:TIGR04255 family protein n=1 Tax=Pseudomonas coronafaciens TaxID=53409 RepID=UPI0005A4C4E7|nr:TIGR04255 family protein [Pseudomonas coronafaciens]KGS15481.1 hypothetical protein OA77_05565 [Pseudomonas coronafaciens]RMU90002.1 hypothetical protein ALP20_01974 [Pseudomonas coronafaciens pv. coronafaciens]
MSKRWKADLLITKRSQNTDRYKRNFLQQAVCEFRFPTLMELGEQRPPAAFVRALRKDYPHLELTNELTLGPGSGNAGSSNVHIFRSTKLNWNVSLKESAITIETTSYTGFDTLRERITKVVKAAEEIIDSDFFTRIGLRYINVIDSGDDPITDWINPALTGAVTSNAFTGISDFAGRMQLKADDGGCTFQHGIRLAQIKEGDQPKPEYLIDIDIFRTEISTQDVADAIEVMHQQAFDLFDWSLTDTSRDYLSKDAKVKKGL